MSDLPKRPLHELLTARITGVMALCLVLLVTNAGTLYWVWRLEKRFSVPIYVSSSSSSAYVSAGALMGISWGIQNGCAFTILPELTSDGQFEAEVSFSLLHKTAGSEMVILHRVQGVGAWTRVPARQDNPLEYRARFAVSTEEPIIDYRAAEVVRGEIIQLSDVQSYVLTQHLEGNVGVSYVPSFQGSGIDRFYFSADRMVTPLSVQEIVVRFSRKSGTVYTAILNRIASGEGMWVDAPPDVESLEVTVTYRDGMERTANLRGPFEQGSIMLIQRGG